MKDFYDDDTDYMGDEDNDTVEKEEETPGWGLEEPTGD
jgi:hypothetical protein